MTSKTKSLSKNERRSKEAVRTWLRLLSCEGSVEQRVRGLFRIHFNVTLPQFDVLSELEHAGQPLTMSQLSTKLMVSNGNVTGVIDRLEKADLVSRSRADHDRRVQFIQLTARGRKEFKEMAIHHERWVDELFSDVTLNDMKNLQKLLLKARKSVTA